MNIYESKELFPHNSLVISRKAIIYNVLLARNRKRTLGYLRKSFEIYVQQQEEYIGRSETHRDYSITKRDAVEHIWLRGKPAECSRKHLNI